MTWNAVDIVENSSNDDQHRMFVIFVSVGKTRNFVDAIHYEICMHVIRYICVCNVNRVQRAEFFN